MHQASGMVVSGCLGRTTTDTVVVTRPGHQLRPSSIGRYVQDTIFLVDLYKALGSSMHISGPNVVGYPAPPA